MFQIFLFLLSVNILCSSQNFPFSIIRNLFDLKIISNPSDLYLRKWINKLEIDLPNDLIKNETKGYIENLTIYNISLESLITNHKKYIDNKIGIEITLRSAAFNISTIIFLIISLVSKSNSIFALSKSIVNPEVSTSVTNPDSFLTK